MYKIAIDGPCASGKTETAKALASILGILAVDTGAIYRALTLFCLQEGIDVNLAEEVIQKTKDVEVYLDKEEVYLNGVCVTDKIRTSKVNANVAILAKIPKVREKVVAIQRKIASSQSVIMQGRDITSVVLPDAELKIYLTASLEERARRRQVDLSQKGEKMSFEEVMESIKKRDEADVTRAVSPLVKTEDSVNIDTTHITLEQVVEKIVVLVKERGLE